MIITIKESYERCTLEHPKSFVSVPNLDPHYDNYTSVMSQLMSKADFAQNHLSFLFNNQRLDRYATEISNVNFKGENINLLRQSWPQISENLRGISDINKLRPNMVSNASDIGSILDKSRYNKTLNDIPDIDTIILDSSHIFVKCDAEILRLILDVVDKAEWCFLLKIPSYLGSGIGLISFFKLWSVLHIEGNFKKFILRVFAINETIWNKVRKSEIQWFNYNYCKFTIINTTMKTRFIAVSPLFLYSLNFWLQPFKSNLTVVNRGFDGALGNVFEGFRANTGQLAFEITKSSSHIMNLAVLGWIDPKINVIKTLLSWWKDNS